MHCSASFCCMPPRASDSSALTTLHGPEPTVASQVRLLRGTGLCMMVSPADAGDETKSDEGNDDEEEVNASSGAHLLLTHSLDNTTAHHLDGRFLPDPASAIATSQIPLPLYYASALLQLLRGGRVYRALADLQLDLADMTNEAGETPSVAKQAEARVTLARTLWQARLLQVREPTTATASSASSNVSIKATALGPVATLAGLYTDVRLNLYSFLTLGELAAIVRTSASLGASVASNIDRLVSLRPWHARLRRWTLSVPQAGSSSKSVFSSAASVVHAFAQSPLARLVTHLEHVECGGQKPGDGSLSPSDELNLLRAVSTAATNCVNLKLDVHLNFNLHLGRLTFPTRMRALELQLNADTTHLDPVASSLVCVAEALVARTTSGQLIDVMLHVMALPQPGHLWSRGEPLCFSAEAVDRLTAGLPQLTSLTLRLGVLSGMDERASDGIRALRLIRVRLRHLRHLTFSSSDLAAGDPNDSTWQAQTWRACLTALLGDATRGETPPPLLEEVLPAEWCYLAQSYLVPLRQRLYTETHIVPVETAEWSSRFGAMDIHEPEEDSASDNDNDDDDEPDEDPYEDLQWCMPQPQGQKLPWR